MRFFWFFFFSVWLFFHEYSRFTGQQVKREAISLYPFYHFHLLHRHLKISWVIAAESSPLRIAGSWNRTGNFWFMLFRIHSFCTCNGSCCCQENAENSGKTGKYFLCLLICNVQRLLLTPNVHAVNIYIFSLVHQKLLFPCLICLVSVIIFIFNWDV